MDKDLKMFSIGDLAEFLNVSQNTKHINSGRIESKKVGGVHSFPFIIIKF